ncbi:MAG: hypothetical protein VX627_03965 [Candidatus Thermoplasmatota archaeon]|nr:hypothetical protein [Candidatus Thermoplasmatota archaeon]
MSELGLPLWQLQVTTAIGLIGVWIGWRGGMNKMVGFYDLPTASRLLLYGFFVGALYQFLASSMVLDPLWANDAFIIGLFIIPLLLSLLTMFFLTREGVRRLNGQPTAGWTFGLGIGSMLVVLLQYRIITTLDPTIGFWVTGFNWQSIIFGFVLAAIVPWSMAIICSWQGWHALEGARFKPAFKAMLLHAMLLVILAFGLTWPIALLFVPAFILWGQHQADSVWLPSGLSPRMKQEWSRLQRTGISTGVRAVANTDEDE